MSVKKNVGGRPPRVAGQKLQRVNLSLQPALMFGLEVVARDRSISLSQAAELAIATLLRQYDVDIDDKTTVKAQQLADAYSQAKGVGDMRVAMDGTVAEHEKTRLELKQITLMPPSLRTKEEAFLIDCIKAQGAHNGTNKVNLTEVAGLLELGRHFFRSGGKIEDVLLGWNL